MALDLMQMIRAALPDDIEDQLGGLLGSDRAQAGAGLNAALPSVLGGLIDKTGSPEGADAVFDQVKDDDGGLLDQLGDLLRAGAGGETGGGLGDVLQRGSGLLGLIFGGRQSGVMGVLARVTGLDDSKLGMLLGLLGPVIMGVLGKHQSQAGLDAGGVAGLLAEQKEPVRRALPAGMGDQLGFAAPPPAPSPAPAAPPRPATPAPAPSGGGGGILKLLIPLVILGGLSYWAYTHFTKPAVFPPANPDMVSDPASELIDLLDRATTSVAGVSDEKSARQAVPQIEAVTAELKSFNMDAMPEAARGPARQLIDRFPDSIAPIVETLEGIPGVGPIISPAVDALLAAVAGLTG